MKLENEGTVVRVENLVKDFRTGFLNLKTTRVLHGVSFSVEQGEIFGFVGPNGAGKTTTLKVLMGLIMAQGGEATVLGESIHNPEFRRHIGYLPEGPYFYDFLTGRELLRFYGKLCHMPAEELEKQIDRLLELVGLSHAGDRLLRAYSKGMLQRVGIAQSIIHDPQIVFLDEPMSGLDPLGRKEIRDLIIRLRDEGKTVFMCTHILSDVEMLCDRVAIIVQGKILYEGRTLEFMEEAERSCEVVLSHLSAEAIRKIESDFATQAVVHGGQAGFVVSEEQVSDIIQLSLVNEGRVVSVTQRRATLEDIFISAVEEKS